MMANLAEETQQAQGPQKAKEAVHQAIRSAHYTEQISQTKAQDYILPFPCLVLDIG